MTVLPRACNEPTGITLFDTKIGAEVTLGARSSAARFAHFGRILLELASFLRKGQ